MLVLCKILSPVLAIWMLISTSWVPVHFHFCMGELAEIYILDESKNCSQELAKKDCHQQIQMKNNDCCDDQTTLLKSTGDLSFSIAKILELVPDYQFLNPHFFLLQDNFSNILAFSLQPNPPPLIATTPTLSLLQSFLL